MAYTVIARKWRPLTFNDVVAQDHIVKTLKNAITYNRIAHAYLFSGPRGIGKTSTARILAKSLNCENGPSTEPCNKCSNCIEITESRSLDVLEIDGASNRGIDEIRNLRENVRYMPIKSKYKIYIIDEVHMLTEQAFNALLKTLEEPPASVIFIFATTQPYDVPSTIQSRCQRFDFKRIPLSEIIKQLKVICDSEGIVIDENSLLVIAKKSDGSMRDSQSVLDQIASFSGNNISFDKVVDVLGIVEQEIFFEITDNILKKNLKEGLRLSQKIILEGYDFEEFFNGLIEHFRNLLVAKITNSSELIETSENYKNRYIKTASNFTEDDILRLISIATTVEASIKRSQLSTTVIETALMKMFRIDRSVDIEDLIRKIDKLKENITEESEQLHIPSKTETLSLFNSYRKEVDTDKKLYGEKTEKPPTVSEQSSKPKQSYDDITLEYILDKWDDIIKKFETEKPYISAFLKDGKPTKLYENSIEISFQEENGFKTTSLKNNNNLIVKIFEEIFHKKFIIKYNIDKSMRPNSHQNQTKENHSNSFDKLKEKEPIINDIMTIFDCKVKDVKNLKNNNM
jgi:DNA polymerase-3 subunit gamma/tau